MQRIISFMYAGARRVKHTLLSVFQQNTTRFIFYCNKVKIGSFVTHGIPFIVIARGGRCTIGKNFRINNNTSSNPIGRVQKCIIAVDKHGELTIGDNVGMSFTAINCRQRILIKENVLIGGGTCIYDSDFHPLDADQRKAGQNDHTKMAPVVIEENVFIGANATILKGVTIGAGSVVGACSVVTRNIPSGEIWAGNPAKFIKTVN